MSTALRIVTRFKSTVKIPSLDAQFRSGVELAQDALSIPIDIVEEIMAEDFPQYALSCPVTFVRVADDPEEARLASRIAFEGSEMASTVPLFVAAPLESWDAPQHFSELLGQLPPNGWCDGITEVESLERVVAEHLRGAAGRRLPPARTLDSARSAALADASMDRGPKRGVRTYLLPRSV